MVLVQQTLDSSAGAAMKKKRFLPFPILFEDNDLIVIVKPAGLLTTHTRLFGRAARESQLTAENLLNDYVRKGQAKSSRRVWLVHRLDRDTSGVMMFAKSEEISEHFRSNWNELTEKIYLARVGGILESEEGVFESYLREDDDGYKVRSVAKGAPRARAARTEWKKISVEDNTTLVEINLKSGRKNQIRVHFSEAGHPLIGDEKYGGERASRLYLHAQTLRFRHPRTGKPMEFTCPFENGKK